MLELINKLFEESKIKYKNNYRNYSYKYIVKKLNKQLTQQELYDIIYKDENKLCPICGKKRKFISFGYGYNKTCSKECSNILAKVNIRGKSYKEIYGNKKVNCGFQKGENNVAKKEDIRIKISKGVLESYKDSNLILKRKEKLLNNPIFLPHKNVKGKNGKFYRSKLESDFAELLEDNNIPFRYEKQFKMNNNHYKYVDFVLYDKIWVEITGYAYDKWQKDFNDKIKIFQNSLDIDNNIIYILTYKNKLDLLLDNLFHHKKLINTNIFYNIINDKENILKDIRFMHQIIRGNEFIRRLNNDN